MLYLVYCTFSDAITGLREKPFAHHGSGEVAGTASSCLATAAKSILGGCRQALPAAADVLFSAHHIIGDDG